MRVEIYQPAAENERFAAGAFDRMINRQVPWVFRATEDGPVLRYLGRATLVAATVDEDGRGVTLTVELDDTGQHGPAVGPDD